MATAENFSFKCGFATLTASLAAKLYFVEHGISIPCSSAVFLAAPTLAVCVLVRLFKTNKNSNDTSRKNSDDTWETDTLLLGIMIGFTTGVLFGSLCHNKFLARLIFAGASLVAYGLSGGYSMYDM